jgi:energy-converting hydrogenase Eha subunit H
MKLHNWMMTHWKPASAFVYTLINLCDFVIFPSYVGMTRVDMITLVDQIRDLDVSVQIQLIQAATNGYSPFTLRGSGLFHLAFGALLTGAAITNGTSGVSYGKNGAEYTRRSEDLDRVSQEHKPDTKD